MKDQIQREYMMVNPQEIVIDMPCDPANVKAKKDSIQQVGIIQPITVWIEGLRVIDGFHRVKAAQELGLAEVPSMVIDCGEEAFWDARIQSAKQHHGIEPDRLAQWMYESWKVSRFVTGLSSPDDFFRFVYENKLGSLWVTGDAQDWFAEKLKIWGFKDSYAAGQHILAIAGILQSAFSRGQIWANKDLFDFAEARRLAKAFGRFGGLREEPIGVEEAKAFLSEPDIPDPYSWIRRRREEERYSKNEQDNEKRRKDAERERQLLATDLGRAIQRKRQMDATADRIEHILQSMAMFVDWSGPFTLAEAIAEDKRVKAQVDLLAAACVEFWRLVGKPLTSEALALENQELRNENQRLQFRLNEYERRAAAAQDRKNKRAAVLSSTDIEYMPEA